MNDNIRIKMLGTFEIIVDGHNVEPQLQKSKKGIALLQYLILQRSESVPNFKLYEVLWPNEESSNPESALKTLVSRMRTLLSKCAEPLAQCILTERGSYRWNDQLGIKVDIYTFESLCQRLNSVKVLDDNVRYAYGELLELYTGALLPGGDQYEWIVSRSISLQGMYLKAVYDYLNLLKAVEDYETIIHVCRTALDIDAFDERLHLDLMNALVKTSRNNEALMQYKHATNLHFRYLGMQPPEGIQEFYKQIVKAGKTLDMSISSIKRELEEYGEIRGAFVCEYAVFKEIYNLQMRNLERLGSTMFIALIMISSVDSKPLDSLKLNDIMNGLLIVLKDNLRKGDTITHYSASQYALLLPTVNIDSGKMVMERLKRLFYVRYPNSSIMFSYRLGPLGSDMPD